MKKTLLGIAALAFAGLAAAQSVDYRLENSGRIWNRIETNASVTGEGTSNAVGKSEMKALANGYITSNPIAGGRELSLGGAVLTEGSAMGFNVRTGNGAGFSNIDGWADANVKGHNSFANQNGTLEIKGETDSGMKSPVGHGVDVAVHAGSGQDGYAAGGDSGSFQAGGFTQQLPIAGGATVSAGVSDKKESNAWSEAGAVSFTGGVPAGQTAAYRHANSGNITEVSGSFYDPVH